MNIEHRLVIFKCMYSQSERNTERRLRYKMYSLPVCSPRLFKFDSLFKPKTDSNHEIRCNEQTALEPVDLGIANTNLDSKHAENEQNDFKMRKVDRHWSSRCPTNKHRQGYDKQGDLSTRTNRDCVCIVEGKR